jgi:hypothetical protein
LGRVGGRRKTEGREKKVTKIKFRKVPAIPQTQPPSYKHKGNSNGLTLILHKLKVDLNIYEQVYTKGDFFP